jgi:phosphatidylinositol-3-phosphatase
MPSRTWALKAVLPRRIGIGLGLLVLAAVVVLLGPGLAPVSSGLAGSGAAPATSGFPTPIQHVFLIVMENEQTDLIYGQQPFQTHLANTYAWGGDANTDPGHVGYYAVCHPSAPNYLSLTSGQPLQCGSDGYKSYSANNVFHVMDQQGVSWIGYAEGAPHNCDTKDNSATHYLQRHDPIHYYSDLGGKASGSVCETHDVAIANLVKDYPYGKVPPAFTYIAPNDIDDGHSSSAATGDQWLKTFVSKLVNTTWFGSSVIFITYDEAYTSAGSDNTTGYSAGGTHLTGGPVYTVSVSKYSKGIGAVDAVDDSHYNLLSTIEWLLGLPPTGSGHDGTSSFPAMKGLFRFPSTETPTTYGISGTVDNDTSEDRAGATVYANNSIGSILTTTSTDGPFNFSLANGTYELTSTAANYSSGTTKVTVAGARVRSLGW